MTAACEVLLGWDGGAKLGEVIHCAPPYDKGGEGGSSDQCGALAELPFWALVGHFDAGRPERCSGCNGFAARGR